MSTHRWSTRALTAVGLWLPLAAAVGQAQTTYTYTVIADVTNCYNIGSPALNNLGAVAFGTNCGAPLGPAGGGIVVVRGDGGPPATIYSWSADSTTQRAPQTDVLSMNDAGVVAFAVNGSCPNGGGSAIWTSNGGPPAVVHDICVQPGFTSVVRPSISNSGAVAFMAASGNSYDMVLRVKDGTLATIAGPGFATPTIGPLLAAIEPAINNHDVVTFTAQAELSYGLFTGAGGPLTQISTDGPSSFNAISDDGRVAFLANSNSVQTSDGGPVTVIASVNPSEGMYQSFPGGGASISAGGGKVAFMAYTPSGILGVFTGADPEADAVLKTGDDIPGLGKVTSLWIAREAINDSGQVAMTAIFDDDAEGLRTIAVIRADPPNTPPTAFDGATSVAAGGSVSGALSASDPDGEPLSYAIVANGSKGTAVIDDASSGAFTYSAIAGTSGEDTFTFQVTDARGLASNVATITVDIQASVTCAVDVSSAVAPAKGKGSKSTGATHNLALTNVSDSPIAGPISVALDALSPAGTTLVNATGVTSCSAPAGSPYVNVDVGADLVWSPGERVTAVLEFAVDASGRGKKPAITYATRVLAGAGGR